LRFLPQWKAQADLKLKTKHVQDFLFLQGGNFEDWFQDFWERRLSEERTEVERIRKGSAKLLIEVVGRSARAGQDDLYRCSFSDREMWMVKIKILLAASHLPVMKGGPDQRY
jgi:hypothetical protein